MRQLHYSIQMEFNHRPSIGYSPRERRRFCARVYYTQGYDNFLWFFDRIGIHWAAAGSKDTESGVLMELEVSHGEAEVRTRKFKLELSS
jgi:hypothetical protein